MKRYIIIYSVLLIMFTISLTCLADTAISGTRVYNGADDEGNVFTYIFSKILDITDDVKDIGIKIGERWFSIIKDDDTTQFEQSKKSGAFGIGIKDDNRVLGDVYTASPMALDLSGNIIAQGESVEISHKVGKIAIQTIASPVSRAITGIINVKLNGEYIYFVNPPYIKNGIIFIKAKDFAKINEVLYTELNGCITMENDTIKIITNTGSCEVSVNNEVYTLTNPVGNDTFISLDEFTKFVDMDFYYDSENMLVTLSR